MRHDGMQRQRSLILHSSFIILHSLLRIPPPRQSKDNPSAALKATIQWKEGVDHSGADETITWLTSDFSVVSVENGVLTAKKAGTATITAMTAEGDTATCTVTVTWNDGGSTTDPGDGDGDNNGDGQEPADNGGCSGAMGIGAGVAALSVVSLAACAAAVSAKKKANKLK